MHTRDLPVDLVLSSGFLAFGAHAGFLAGVTDAGLAVGGVCGTSSGALAGALWASGMSPEAVLAELTRRAPLAWASLHRAPWRGLFRLDGVLAELRDRLPPTFAALERPFGVGVVDADGRHRLIVDGPLPEAVLASCAVPWLFAPIEVDGAAWSDGGALDRTALGPWRRLRPEPPVVVHLVDRSHGAAVDHDLTGLRVVRSPRSGARLWSLGDPRGAYDAARAAARTALLPP
ncbi:MAG: patatin-like phospholipase family protein [Myxococcota bacterium]